MSHPAPEQMKLAWVRWLDAGAQHCTWRDAEGLDVRAELQTAGIVAYEDEHVITLAADFDGKQYRDISSIPKSCVVEARYFEVKTKSKCEVAS